MCCGPWHATPGDGLERVGTSYFCRALCGLLLGTGVAAFTEERLGVVSAFARFLELDRRICAKGKQLLAPGHRVDLLVWCRQ